MKKQNNRIARIESDIQRLLSEVLAFGIKDPRVGALVSVSRVEVTRDMSYATIYVTGQSDAEELLAGLTSAKGYLRKKLAEEMTTFRIPDLLFKYDDSAGYLNRIDELLAQVAKKGVSTNTLEEIGNTLRMDQYETVAILPHIFADGDAIGSCVAMYHALELLGKKPYLVMAERPAMNLVFLTEGLRICDSQGEDSPRFDLAISLDTGSVGQIRDRKALFLDAPKTVSIDHHKTNEGFADMVYVDVQAAATSEILYDLFRTMGIEITPLIARALYTAISTDTGSFKHSNTTGKSFRIAADLLDTGFDFTDVTNHVYKSVPRRKAELLQIALNNLQILDGGVAVSNAFERPSEDSGDYDGIVEYILTLEGVEVAVFARQLSDTELKFSMRSKHDIDVSAIAESLGGGGHVKAAGFVTTMSFEEAVKQIVLAVQRADE